MRRHATTVRIPDDLAARLESEAKRLGYPANWLLARILREGLDALPDAISLTAPRPDPPSSPSSPPPLSTR